MRMADFFGIESPFLHLCGIRAVSREPGRVVAEVELTPEVANRFGFGHGGLTMTLLDSCLGTAARFSDPAALSVLTVDLHVSFVGPARGRLVAEGRVVRRAGEIISCEGDVRGGDGDLVAKALGTFKLRV
jgi:uncharacterized protein (TIGR00369 family)